MSRPLIIALVLGAAACAPKKDFTSIVIVEGPPAALICKEVGPLSVASQDKEEEAARRDARNDLRGDTAWIGGTHAVLEGEEVDDVQLGLGFAGKGKKVSLTGRALKCAKPDKPAKKKTKKTRN